jgi:hypothetical protein
MILVSVFYYLNEFLLRLITHSELPRLSYFTTILSNSSLLSIILSIKTDLLLGLALESNLGYKLKFLFVYIILGEKTPALILSLNFF